MGNTEYDQGTKETNHFILRENIPGANFPWFTRVLTALSGDLRIQSQCPGVVLVHVYCLLCAHKRDRDRQTAQPSQTTCT